MRLQTIRSRLDLFIPITKTSYNEDKDLYAILWAELFTYFEDNLQERFRKTYRLYTGLGYRFSYRWRLEVDHVLQKSRDSITDDQFENTSNALLITLKHYLQPGSE